MESDGTARAALSLDDLALGEETTLADRNRSQAHLPVISGDMLSGDAPTRRKLIARQQGLKRTAVCSFSLAGRTVFDGHRQPPPSGAGTSFTSINPRQS